MISRRSSAAALAAKASKNSSCDGASGMGAYHGEWGFQALSHRKAVLAKTTKPDLKLLYPPYTDKGLKIMRRILG